MGIPGNLSPGDNLLLPTWTLTWAVGAGEDSVTGGPPPVSGPSGGRSLPRKLRARQMSEGVEGDRKSVASGADTRPPADQRVSETDPAFPEPR